ncbi:DUF6703 family protein [Actinomadura sp. 21ATH]|uniref:DUF6703 family protein n=1 Tax=Actinomadura sp. 21ATH TaxID=1735444 RepID=UPI0035C17BDD
MFGHPVAGNRNHPPILAPGVPGPDGRTLILVNTEKPSGTRAAVERWSAAPLVFLTRLPRWVLLAVILALVAVGLVGSGWVGAAGLLVLLVLLSWFAYLSWPGLGMQGRILRIAALVLVAAFAVDHLL